MFNNKISIRRIRCLLVHASTVRALLPAIGAALLLASCGLSKPGTSDIEPYVLDQFGECQLWTVSDVHKEDGIADGNAYRIDFTAKLTLKGTPKETMAAYRQHQMDPAYAGCHQYVMYLAVPATEPVQSKEDLVTFAKQYDVKGAGLLVKSEKGWRLKGRLQADFDPL